MRRDLEVLVSLVASTPGITDVALTTNGSLLAAHAQSLRDAGLHRVTVSLDSLDPTVFAAMGDTKLPLSKVLDGTAAAADAGLAPIKLNTVLRRGMNEAGLLDLVGFARDGGYVLRCIQYMDAGRPPACCSRRVGWPAGRRSSRVARAHHVRHFPALRRCLRLGNPVWVSWGVAGGPWSGGGQLVGRAAPSRLARFWWRRS
jgi:cyclic pyranopterin phosphate synthase